MDLKILKMENQKSKVVLVIEQLRQDVTPDYWFKETRLNRVYVDEKTNNISP